MVSYDEYQYALKISEQLKLAKSDPVEFERKYCMVYTKDIVDSLQDIYIRKNLEWVIRQYKEEKAKIDKERNQKDQAERESFENSSRGKRFKLYEGIDLWSAKIQAVLHYILQYSLIAFTIVSLVVFWMYHPYCSYSGITLSIVAVCALIILIDSMCMHGYTATRTYYVFDYSLSEVCKPLRITLLRLFYYVADILHYVSLAVLLMLLCIEPLWYVNILGFLSYVGGLVFYIYARSGLKYNIEDFSKAYYARTIGKKLLLSSVYVAIVVVAYWCVVGFDTPNPVENLINQYYQFLVN